nr:MAG TPA: hypothetical protein [Bacteriophage sp.]DAV62071.1 MAG TPA: hypothetical protein [Caudoviricetes sp.]
MLEHNPFRFVFHSFYLQLNLFLSVFLILQFLY